MNLSEPKKKLSEPKMREFLEILSHERFAKIYFKFSTTPLIVLSKKEMYMFNPEFKYYQQVEQTGRLMNLVSEVLHTALKTFNDHFEQKYRELKCDKTSEKEHIKEAMSDMVKVIKQVNTATKSIETTTFIKNVVEQIISKSLLSREEQEKLNRLENHLNFRNGKLDLKTMVFTDRTEDDFVTEYLNYDFQLKPNKEVKSEVTEVLKKICNSDDGDFDFITNFLAYCITSETKEQKYLNVVGPSASNGKSTIIKLMEEALSIYIFKAKKDLFSEAYSKGHKYFAQTKNKRIVYIEELDKKKVDADLIKDVVDGNQINNEVLFATTEKIDINFKLMFLSNNLMNFDADSGIKRRLIHFEFRNKFVAQQDLEKERANHKIGKVFPLDNSLVSKFHNNDDYKNALIHILIKKAKQYFDIGLTVPEKYVEIAKEICEENDKFKNFFENHFEVTNNESDRLSKDELRDMYNSHTKCNFSASSIMTDIQRLQLKYERGLRCIYNGMSLRGVIVGIKKKTGQEEEEEPPVKASKKTTKQELPDPTGLDYGIPCTELDNDDIIRRLKDKEEEVNDLNEQYEKMRLEFEAYKQQFPAVPPQAPVVKENSYIPELKLAYAQIRKEQKEASEKSSELHKKWYAALSKEEQKKEDERSYNEGAHESENRDKWKTDYVEEYESLIRKAEKAKEKAKLYVKAKEGANFIDEDIDDPPPPPKPEPKQSKVKSVLSIIDGSDDEDEGEEESTTINVKSHKIVKAINALDIDFIE